MKVGDKVRFSALPNYYTVGNVGADGQHVELVEFPHRVFEASRFDVLDETSAYPVSLDDQIATARRALRVLEIRKALETAGGVVLFSNPLTKEDLLAGRSSQATRYSSVLWGGTLEELKEALGV